MKQALEFLSADLLAAGVRPREARDVRRSYALALSRQNGAAWIAFYRAVFAALNRSRITVFAESETRRAARTSLLRLLEDDLGSTLFSPSKIARLRDENAPTRRREPIGLWFSPAG